MLHLEFTPIFTTNFVDSLNIRASQEVFPIEDRSPEITEVQLLTSIMYLDNVAAGREEFCPKRWLKLQKEMLENDA